MDQTRLLRKLIKIIENQGWDWRRNKKHLMLYPKDKSMEAVCMSVTPGDCHSWANSLSRLKRAGLDVSELKT